MSIAVCFLGCLNRSNRPDNRGDLAKSTLHVAAAANLNTAFETVIAAFELRYPNVDVVTTFGSSGNLFAQLAQQAPFDIFFSADTNYPRKLIERQLASPESYFEYARGRIVVWVPSESPLDLEGQGIRAILSPTVRKIAIANPRLAPYGAAAEEALKSANLYDEVQGRLVIAENVAQTAQFVETGGADVGILALSQALEPSLKKRGRYCEIPPDAYRPIVQGGIIPAYCDNRTAAMQFRDFVQHGEGREILGQFGYSTSEN